MSSYRVYYAVGMLLFVGGLIAWSAVDAPGPIMLTSIILLCYGSSFLAVLPLWKRISLLEQQVQNNSSS